MIHLLFVPMLVPVLVILIVVRMLTRPWRRGYWHRRGCWGRGYSGYDGYRNPYGVGPSLLTIVALVAMERLFGRRYY